MQYLIKSFKIFVVFEMFVKIQTDYEKTELEIILVFQYFSAPYSQMEYKYIQ